MRPARNKEAIIKASLSLFCRKGFSDTSVKEIADMAGVSPGNVYNYFKSKDEIFDFLFGMYFPGNYIEMLIDGIDSSRPLEENMDTVLNNILGFVEQNPYFFKLVLVDANEFEGRYLKRYGQSYYMPIEEYFHNRIDMPELRKDIESMDFTDFFSWLFYSIGLTGIIYENIGDSGLKNTRVYRVLLKILKKGLKK